MSTSSAADGYGRDAYAMAMRAQQRPCDPASSTTKTLPAADPPAADGASPSSRRLDPLDAETGTWCDLPAERRGAPVPRQLPAGVGRGPVAYDDAKGVWSDLPVYTEEEYALAAVDGVPRDVLDAMIQGALIIGDDSLLRRLVSVQQFGSRSSSYDEVIELGRTHAVSTSAAEPSSSATAEAADVAAEAEAAAAATGSGGHARFASTTSTTP